MKANNRRFCLGAIGLVGFAGISVALVTPAIAHSPQHNRYSEITPQSEILVAQSNNDIVDVATASDSFNTLIGLLTELGMAEDLRGYGRFTVFAPTNAAFEAIPNDVLQALAGDRELLAQVLAYHVVAEREPYSVDDFSGSQSLRTLERSEITVSRRGRSLSVNGIDVIEADIEASNGVIHVIDQVLIPESVLSQIR
ncbi:fasciclin domain-containing protein [Leptolyngbya sp. FACHB-541]|uniref:fasciclin domain-containing protein n=1 Tax=Leptolyngbya sp. FACHB-541 TaxID=2692810 RepID=UPI001681D182|nr:fasciclin domain-containing protein [Leptolyngbya sp. FACHB-541]MBD1999094.1 fasciclin domain-containing protein [Leptolyngbya sp. FACHB-541]